jgi:tetratricopeptide (TPR) repeat protein
MVGFERLEVQEEDAAAHPPPGPTLLQIEPLHAPALPSSDDAVALNELGAARRQAGDLEEAATAFHRAAQAFEARGMRAEHAAATFNLGLVERQRGDREGAIACFERARALLGHDAAPAAAAARELGAALLEAGRPADAIAPLEEALRLAAVGNDRPGAGAAANVLGLVHLAGGRPAQAVEVLREALACHPRSVRPEDYAMVKANLALAYDQAGDARRARVAARQALGVPAAAGPVREQAAALLERLGDSPGDLVAILDAEPPERWPALLREEAARLADADDDSREGEARAWLNARLDREDDRADELCEHWLGALLELPPTAMEALIRAELDARAGLDPAARARLEAQTERASARFPPPQLVRLHEAFARIGAGVVGEPSRRYM